MIQNFVPQGFPLWAVERKGEEAMLVIGWAPSAEHGDDRYLPVVAPIGLCGAGAWVADSDVDLYTTRTAALDTAEQNMLDNSRHDPGPVS